MRKVSEESGVSTSLAVDDETNKVIVQTEQEVGHILDANRREYATYDERARWGEGLMEQSHRVARIPNAVIVELNTKGIMRGFHVIDPKGFKAFLNNPENQYLRTRPGRV